MRQYEATVRHSKGEVGETHKVFATYALQAHDKLRAKFPDAGITAPQLVPLDEQTEEGSENA